MLSTESTLNPEILNQMILSAESEVGVVHAELNNSVIISTLTNSKLSEEQKEEIVAKVRSPVVPKDNLTEGKKIEVERILHSWNERNPDNKVEVGERKQIARDTNGSESKVVKRSCDIDAGHVGQITMLQLSWEEDACIRSLQAVYGSDKVGDIHRTGYIYGSDEDTEKENIPVESKIVKIVTMHEKSTGSLTSIEVSTIFRGLSKYRGMLVI